MSDNPLKILRGLEANRLGITPLLAQLLWTTDEKILYIGDGTAGGYQLSVNWKSGTEAGFHSLGIDDNATALAMTIDSAGNVGIGTTSPDYRLQVVQNAATMEFQGAVAGDALLRIYGASGGDAALYFGDADDVVRGGIVYNTSENALQFRGYNNSTRMVIDSAGNVGIGITDPAGHRLNVLSASEAASTFIQRTTTQGIKIWGDSLRNWIKAESATVKALTFVENSGGRIDFHTGSVGAPTERMRINSVGNVGIGIIPTHKLDVAGDIHLTGDLIADSGQGIDFSATSDATGSTSELLDDYEEGTWTPVLSDGTRDAPMTIQVAHYTRVGNTVHFTCRFSINSVGSLLGTIRVTGLPYTAHNVTNAHATVHSGWAVGLSGTAGENAAGYISPNSAHITLTKWGLVAGTANMTNTDITLITGMMLAGSYKV